MSNPRHLPPVPPVPPVVVDPGPCSLAEELAEVVNDVRSMETELGVRPYRVFSVRVHWSGGERGRGDVTEVLTREFLPRPKVSFRTRREFTSAGIVERGTVELASVNPQLTADEVADLFHQTPLGKAEEAYIEIVMDGRDGPSQRRRFVAAEPPVRHAFEWRVSLRQQDGARDRAGRVSYPGRRP
jgi:hypothetical protein